MCCDNNADVFDGFNDAMGIHNVCGVKEFQLPEKFNKNLDISRVLVSYVEKLHRFEK